MKTPRMSTRRVAGAAALMLASAILLTACSSTGSTSINGTAAGAVPAVKPEGGCPKPASITIWGITTSSSQQAFDASHAAAFEKACPGSKITYTYSQNTQLKTKLTAAMAGGTPPTIFQSFGYGDLSPYATEGKVVNLGTALKSTDASWTDKFLSSSLVPGTVDGSKYGFPVWGAQPKLLFYNKAVFKKLGISAPTTMAELNTDITKIKKAGIIPIALGDQDQSPSTYWLGYLANRAGGTAPYEKVYAGKANAWSDPAFTTALTQLQQMGKSGAFGTGYDSTGDVDGAASALLYTGKAAMKLDGTWVYNAIQSADPSFISSGDLGYVPFPSGTKKANDGVFGNASSVYSVTTDASSAQKAVAYAYMTTQLTTSNYAKGQAKIGYVPALKNALSDIPSTGIGKLNRLAYTTAETPGAYQVDPQIALGTIGNIYMQQSAGIVNSSVSVSQFQAKMNGTIK